LEHMARQMTCRHHPCTKPSTHQASADDKFANYKPTTAFFFPGQGAQSVGMAKVRAQRMCVCGGVCARVLSRSAVVAEVGAASTAGERSAPADL
jgi:hypothetical protein